MFLECAAGQAVKPQVPRSVEQGLFHEKTSDNELSSFAVVPDLARTDSKAGLTKTAHEPPVYTLLNALHHSLK